MGIHDEFLGISENPDKDQENVYNMIKKKKILWYIKGYLKQKGILI